MLVQRTRRWPALNQHRISVYTWPCHSSQGWPHHYVDLAASQTLHSALVLSKPTSEYHMSAHSQHTRDIEPTLGQCWAEVVDGGSTLNQHWFNVSCLLCPVCSLTALPVVCYYLLTVRELITFLLPLIPFSRYFVLKLVLA